MCCQVCVCVCAEASTDHPPALVGSGCLLSTFRNFCPKSDSNKERMGKCHLTCPGFGVVHMSRSRALTLLTQAQWAQVQVVAGGRGGDVSAAPAPTVPDVVVFAFASFVGGRVVSTSAT